MAHLPVPLLGAPCRSLVVHVVGARSAESSRVARWEILARGMPRLRRLSVVFVGPELRWVNKLNADLACIQEGDVNI